MMVKKWTLTPNGKINRKALPEPDMSLLQGFYVQPATDTQRKLCQIWEDVLEVEKIGITDNFFNLGGNSLLVLKVLSRAKKVGLFPTVGDVWKYQTIAQLSASLQALDSHDAVEQLVEQMKTNIVVADMNKSKCRVELLHLDAPFNETYLRHAVNKLLSDEQLSYRALQQDGQYALVKVERSRKERNAMWRIFDGDQTDADSFADIQTRRLCDEIMGFDNELVGLAYLNHHDQQICVLAVHESVIDESNWQALVREFNGALALLLDEKLKNTGLVD